jgi:vancomycin resistance protein YoaR
MSTIPVQKPQPSGRPSTPRYDEPAFNPWWVRLPLLTALGGMFFVISVLGLLVVYQNQYAGKVLPGVSVSGIPLSGMTPEQAAMLLAAQYTFDEDAIFTFRDPTSERFWQLTAGDLGVRFDADATLAAAMQAGRQEAPLDNLLTQASQWLNGLAIAPVVVYDQADAFQQLSAIAAEINQTAASGSLELISGQVSQTTGQIGRTLDIPATLAKLNQSLQTLSTGAEIELVISETQPEIGGVNETSSKVQAALSAPMTLITDDGTAAATPVGPWTISTDQLSALLKIDQHANGDGTERYDVSVDMEPFRPYLETLAPALKTQPTDARFHFNDTTGQLELLKAGVGGRTMNIDQTLANLEEKVFNPTDRTVQIAYDYVQPRYHNNITAAELGIKELVVEASTYYSGSPDNRRQNIAVGTALYDGIVIGPGEEFSFNSWLGELSEEAGFTEGNVIFGGRTVSGIGGGICQVSTTIFRAAFYGGYTIIERNAHPYRVGYYEQNSAPGFDAAIWTPERDFRFQNDTPYHLLIEAEVFPATNTLQFRFYSTKTDRQVEIKAPIIKNQEPARETLYESNPDLSPGQIVQVDYAAEGADVTVQRIIRDAQGNILKEDSIYTHYLPWGAIYQVAPGDTRLSG